MAGGIGEWPGGGGNSLLSPANTLLLTTESWDGKQRGHSAQPGAYCLALDAEAERKDFS